MDLTDIIGYLAALIGTFLMVPQVVNSLRTKSVGDISGAMLAAYLVQCALWAVYGLRMHAMPIILCNTIAFCIGVVQVVLKIKYSKK